MVDRHTLLQHFSLQMSYIITSWNLAHPVYTQFLNWWKINCYRQHQKMNIFRVSAITSFRFPVSLDIPVVEFFPQINPKVKVCMHPASTPGLVQQIWPYTILKPPLATYCSFQWYLSEVIHKSAEVVMLLIEVTWRISSNDDGYS